METTSTTYTRARAAYPERVGKAGRWAPVGPVTGEGTQLAVSVIDYGDGSAVWSLYIRNLYTDASRFIVKGNATTSVAAWLDGCTAADAYLADLVEVVR